MKETAIIAAKNEAKRFLARVEAFEDRLATDSHFRKYIGITGFKETAALKRASLDLSAALSDMRKL